MSEPSASICLKALSCAREAAQSVGSLLLSGPSEVSVKSSASDIVTDIDIAAEQQIRAHISSVFPSHRIVGEELDDVGHDPDWTWYIDPIDGTTNYARGLPWYAVSIALSFRNEPVVGVVHNPATGFLASTIRGRQLSHTPATRSRQHETIAGSLILTEWNVARPFPGQDSLMEFLASADATTRVMGSGTLSLSYTAVGAADAAMIGSYNPVDHAAGWLLCAEAGLVCLDLHHRTIVPQPPASPFVIGHDRAVNAIGEFISTIDSP
ncbi:MAG: inositol monophosphatase [Actinomycetaceae bacterium]|nr:inositol monophosphatase [Actinomycetaceae bacterium]